MKLSNICNEIINKMDYELNLLKLQSSNIILVAEKAIGLCKLAFLEMKKLVKKDGFESVNEEIGFFKILKPKVFSKLIFYVELLRIETHRPKANKKLQLNFLYNRLNND